MSVVEWVGAREYLERWVRWGVGVPVGQRSILGKIMDGLGSTVCPTCRGQGRAPGHVVGSAVRWIDPCPQCNGLKRVNAELSASIRTRQRPCPNCNYDAKHCTPGEVKGRTCSRCYGSGQLMQISLQVNPAGIRGTRYFGVNEDNDPVSEAIDRLVSSWMQHDETVWLNRVILEEYLTYGTQEAKAAGLGISQSFYSQRLSEAHARIGDLIGSI